MNTPLDILAGKLPPGFCYQNPQQLLEAFVAALTAYLPSNFNTFNQGGRPSEQNRDKPWLKLANGVIERWYVWDATQGKWVWPHPVPPGAAERRIYRGTVESLVTYDGGEAGAEGDASGPMWKVDPDLSGRFPFGADEDVVLDRTESGAAPNNQAGAKTVTLTVENLPAHTHNLEPAIAGPTPSQVYLVTSYSSGNQISSQGSNGTPVLDLTQVRAASVGGGVAVNNMPPFIGVHFIQRTARKYYVG